MFQSIMTLGKVTNTYSTGIYTAHFIYKTSTPAHSFIYLINQSCGSSAMHKPMQI